MYALVLFTHSWLRYAVLALALLLVFFAWQARRSGQWHRAHERTHVAFVAVLDLQLLLGLLLMFALSPIASAALADLGSAMRLAELRFYGVEHPATMLLAVIVAHAGRARSKHRPPAARARIVLWTQVVFLLLTLLAIPWPTLDVGRPLWRGF